MTSQRRQELFLDGIELSIEMVSIAYENLCSAIAKNTEATKQNKPPDFSVTHRIVGKPAGSQDYPFRNGLHQNHVVRPNALLNPEG